MSMPITLENTTEVTFGRRLLARAAVGVARLLVRRSPLRLKQILERLSRGADPASTARALAARQAVVTVSSRCASQQCLQRSVATALLCRISGVWPDWRTGVRTEPFRAHAWVEVDEHAVGENEDMSLYRVMLSVPARRFSC
ncbi:lasso peptide biosynthesis B2 protein [Allokutzneria sp. A3M-2-11 16]|uniref:lasso peptide biosynthesis B2 protein n=1 Tax=Allokutzneria sp. A3M-2-11 16 TaxID=2962043 RepID=UPI0020B63F97|nr:lasso peptide biosynthesis B2 protein [Allokutzneria sp. A3M-2-11 16]MCP3803395.1 lasso peptide biosynthesis B2 protein [Allokutzneria sp. A3M-2-11 16]